jgi:hypothetical protein
MGKVLEFKRARGAAPNNLIALKLLEFRSADWESVPFYPDAAISISGAGKASEKCTKRGMEFYSLPLILFSAAVWLLPFRTSFVSEKTRKK